MSVSQIKAKDLVLRIRRAIDELEPDLLEQKFEEFRRGGLPSKSTPDRGGGNQPLPLPDTLDEKIEAGEDHYLVELDTALDALVHARIEQNWWLNAAPDVAGVPTRPTCPTCGRKPKGTGNDRIIQGECRRCWAYRVRNDKAWTPPTKPKRKKKRRKR